MRPCNCLSHFTNHLGNEYGEIIDAFGAKRWRACNPDEDLAQVTDELLDIKSRVPVRDIVDEFGRVRGDLSNQRARDHMTDILERKFQFAQDAADSYTDKSEQLDRQLDDLKLLERDLVEYRNSLVILAKSTYSAATDTHKAVAVDLDEIITHHQQRVAIVEES